MKKIKKLHLRPGQALSEQQQRFVIAGEGKWLGDWQGACTCQKLHNSHIETRKKLISDPNVAQALLGSAEAGVGCAAILSGLATEGLSGGTSTALVLSGIEMFFDGVNNATSGAFRNSTVEYKRVMELTNEASWTHTQKSITSSLI